MDSLRRRIPFKVIEDDDDDNDSYIYDEQQQELMIRELRREADTFNRKALMSVRILVGLSCIIQLLFNLPFLAIFSPKESVPLRIIIIFSMLSFLIHYHLAVILSSQFRDIFYPYNDPTPVSYRFLYLVSALAPIISFCSRIPWKVAIWWIYTPLIVFAVQRAMNSIEDANRGIANLEALKYRAPGA